MRLFVPSASIAIISGTVAPAPQNKVFLETRSNVAKKVDYSYSPLQVGERSLMQECKVIQEVDAVDVGLLGCRNPNAVCVEDESSTLGGRCVIDRTLLTPKQNLPSFSKRRSGAFFQAESSSRFLQGWSCPTNCPEEFCTCAQAYGEVKHCVEEMDQICTSGVVPNCIPKDYLNFYYQTYCPFAECIVTKNSYEFCSCEYYRNYCTLYYAFVESTPQCEIAACCESKNTAESKKLCLPGMQPTMTPTTDPTSSSMPSDTPSISSEPTISPAPTISSPPTITPSISSSPTSSSAPSKSPSTSPTIYPTISPVPTSTPTTTPYPTSSPTITSKPTISLSPVSPTVQPTTPPTISFSPSLNLLEPTLTVSPTKDPTPRPTKYRTRSPTKSLSSENSTSVEDRNSAETVDKVVSNGSTFIRPALTVFIHIGAFWFLML